MTRNTIELFMLGWVIGELIYIFSFVRQSPFTLVSVFLITVLIAFRLTDWDSENE